MSAEVAKVLQEARGFVERGWTQGAIARDARGREVQAMGEAAVRWCANGAIVRAADDNSRLWTLARMAMTRVVGSHVAPINDAATTTQADVLGWFDAAIAKESAS